MITDMINIAELSITKRVFIIFIGIVFFLGASLCISWVYIQSSFGDKLYPYIYIDGIDMSKKTKAEALNMLKKRDDYFQSAILEVLYNEQPIATFSGQQLHLTRNTDIKVNQAYIIGRSDSISTRVAQQLNALFHFRNYTFSSGIRYNDSPIQEFVQIAQETYNIPAENALFTFENGKVSAFKTHKNGKEIKSDEFLIEIHAAIQGITENAPNKKIVIKDTVIEPAITLAKANSLGIEKLIGEGVSNYSHSIASRIHNVILAASKLNGLIIPKDAIFSFNANIGDISATTGYQPAYIIKSGRTVLGDGGGVCQVSTTMFRAALNTGLPIIERTAHAYRVSYYENDSEPGFDATIFSPSVDLKFKNDTPGAILIETEIDKSNSILKFKIYGQSDGRKVKISPVSVWDIVSAPEPTYEDDPTLPSGTIKQVDYAASGAKARFDYRVYDSNGNMTIDKTFISSYRPWQAVFLKGTGASL